MARPLEERGQASVELMATVPVLLLVTLLVAQLALAGYALWRAGIAARAGARADYVGGNAEAAARSSLPLILRPQAAVSDGNAVAVRVDAPSLVPGVSSIPVTARAAMGVGDGDAR